MKTFKQYIFEKLKIKKVKTNIFSELQPLRKIDFDYWDFAEVFEKWAKKFNEEPVVYPLENTFYNSNELPIVEGTSDPYRPNAFYPDQYVTGLMVGKTSEYDTDCFRLQTRINPEDVEKYNEINKKRNSCLPEIFSYVVWKGNRKLELAKILGKGDYKMGYAVMKYIYDEITSEIV